MSNVITFPEKVRSKNRECPKCGGQWWVVQAVVMTEDLSIGGFAGIPECYECAKPELRSV